ncbi:MAG: divergent PAP2 family protein [Halanaerobiales bacterium]
MITFFVPLLSLFIAQIIKIFTAKPFAITRIVGSGGMPSSHAAFVSSLSTLIGLRHGFNSDLFAVVAIFSLIIIYDAGGVRRAVGKQANVLNHLLQNLDLSKLDQEKKFIREDLRELIGHTPYEVLVGTALGVILAVIFQLYLL